MSSYSTVPSALKSLPNWVLWKLEDRGDGKLTKIPYTPPVTGDTGTAAPAKANDPATWRPFEQAVKASDILSSGEYFSGIGFELKDTDYVGFDFDGVRTDDGSIEPYALALIGRLANAYVEITPSAHGLRAFVECSQLPAGKRKFTTDGYGVEIYSGGEAGRYLTITGNRFSGDGIPRFDDLSLVYLLCSQIHNEKFKALWLGDISKYGNDQSRADLALLGILARLTNHDAVKMEQYFSQSQLGQRVKWRDREDYRERSIKAALSGKKQIEDDAESQPEVKTPNITNAANIRTKHISWLWRGRIPLGKVTLFAGNPDNGKSLASTWLTATCTTGRDFPDELNTTPASDVLMILGEDETDDTVKPRLQAAGANVSRVYFLDGIKLATGDRDIRLDLDMDIIERVLQDNPNIKLIIIDPISSFLGETNMMAEQETRNEVLSPIRRLAAKYGIAVLVVMHLNKKAERDAVNRVGGAMSFVGVARAGWLFQRDKDDGGKLLDTFSMVPLKGNLVRADLGGLTFKMSATKLAFDDGVEDWVPFVSWVGTTAKSADDVLGSHRSAGRPQGTDAKVQKGVQYLSEALKDGRQSTKVVVKNAFEAENISKATMYRAAEKLGVKKIREGDNHYWELRPVQAVTEEAYETDTAAEISFK